MSGRNNWDRVRVEQKRATHEPLKSAAAYIDERKPLTNRQRNLIRELRIELGVIDTKMPETNREGRALITALLGKKRRGGA